MQCTYGDSDHLFFECLYSQYIWILLRLKLGLPAAPIANLNQEALYFSSKFTVKIYGTALARIAFRTIVWALWRERNLRKHKGQANMKLKLASDINYHVILQLYSCKW